MAASIVVARELDFLLYDLLAVQGLASTARHAGQDRELWTAVLDTAARVAAEHFAPQAAALDADEPRFDGERVYIRDSVRRALDAYREAGFFGVGFDLADGGLQLPWTVCQAAAAHFNAADVSVAAYPFLTIAAANMLARFGSPAQRRRYLPALVAGEWFGTMCMSEPQAGSSLADVRCRATPQASGDYHLSGTKMWISGGEHELSDNIVHMVLARLPDAPAGVRGLSLFIVPRRHVDAGGRAGGRNDVRLIGLNHKMGWRGTVNTVLAFGEAGACHAELLGAPQQGLAIMFHMMNEARIGVGLCATMLGYAGYRHALAYARERPQGRAPGSKDPSTPPRRIIEHADVRRLLLAQKAAVEGALALTLYCASLVDRQRCASTSTEAAHSTTLLDILTPIAKSWPAEFCLDANRLAMQVLGGYGYSRDFPVERLYRDNRLNAIHEGTHGIQALDLLGRKVRQHEGAAFAALMDEMAATTAVARSDARLAAHALALDAGCAAISAATAAVLACPDAERGLANASVYLDALGQLVIAWMWLRQAHAAQRLLASAPDQERAFLAGKLRACDYFFRHELPRVGTQAALIASLDDTCLGMPESDF